MFAQERQAEISRLVEAVQRVSGADLARQFGVTMETVRRDLAALEAAGVLRRVHGGAVSTGSGRPSDPSAGLRSPLKSPGKQRIAAAALELLRTSEASTIILDAGSSAETFAETLAVHPGAQQEGPLKVITHALNVAVQLADQPDVELELIGGRVRTLTWATSGASVVEQYARIRADVAFMGCNGVSADFGFSTPERFEAAVKSQMLRAARRRVMLCDAPKHDHETFAQFADFHDIDVMITDEQPPPSLSQALADGGVEVIVS